MSDWPLLSLVIFLPLAGAGFIMLIRGEPEVVAQNARAVALWTSGITFLLSLLIWGSFDPTTHDFQMVEQAEWFVGFNINYHVGVDGISLWFVILSTLLTLLCVISSWHSIQTRIKEFMVAFLIMDTFMVGVFCALDMVLFYIFFEGILIPMFLIIGIWGGPNRVYSAFKFFLYTLLGSVLFLVAILVLYFHEGTTDIPTLMAGELRPDAAEVAVARDVRLVRGQDPDVAVPHLAAGCPCRGADRGLDPFGGRAAEARRLRLSALLAADAAGRLRVLHAADLHALGRRGDLHLPGRADAGGHEEADRLLVDRPHGHRHDRHLHAECARPGRQHLPDAEPRHRVGRAVHGRGRGLRPPAHPRDRPLRRPGRAHADLCRGLHAVLAGVGRPARHLGLRRRDPGDCRRLPDQQLGRPARRDRRLPLRSPTCSGSTGGCSSAPWSRTT